MRSYYSEKCEQYKSNTRKLWELMNWVINKTKHTGSVISHIMIDGVKRYNGKVLANEFGKFYVGMGVDLAAKIPSGITKSDDYITQIPRTSKSMVFKCTTETEIKRIIDQLQDKTSSGHHKVSNVLLKN